MKLLYIINARIPTEKAHGIHAMKMCEALAHCFAEGSPVNVELLCSKRFNLTHEDPFQFYGIMPCFAIKKLWSPLFFQSGSDLFQKIGFYLQIFLFAIQAAIYALQNQPSHVYTRDLFTAFVLSFTNISFGFEFHTTNSPQFIIKRVVKKAKIIIVISQGLKRYIAESCLAPKERLIVLHDAVDLSEFETPLNNEQLRAHLSLPAEKKIITYVGKYKTMGIEKGVRDIIEAFVHIIKKQEDTFLLIVGLNNDELSEVEEIFLRLEISDGAYKLVKHVPHTDALLYMKASNVLIMNYPNNPHYAYYMSPLKLFEYMGSGVPIVASDLPSVREILNNDLAVMVLPGDQLLLEEGINSLLNNRAYGEKLAHVAYEEVKKYTWKIRAEKILNLLIK